VKALVLEAYHHFVYTDVPDPVIGPEEVLIEVKACGICGSDVHGVDGSTGRRIPPLIMGHEAAGVVVEVGAQVTEWRPGDRVTFDSTIYCRRCYFCRRGLTNLCDDRRVLGVSCAEYRQEGALAQYVAVPQHVLYRLPEALSFEHATMVEPVSVAFHALKRTPLALDDTAVVVGTGMIGSLVLQALRAAGCGIVIAVDLDPQKLALARRLGADEAFSPETSDVVSGVRQRSEGRGADVAFEVVGIAPTVKLAVACLRRVGP
jgi:L-iditol 2-dehydrogenase